MVVAVAVWNHTVPQSVSESCVVVTLVLTVHMLNLCVVYPAACVVAMVILPGLSHAVVTWVLNICAALRVVPFSVHKF